MSKPPNLTTLQQPIHLNESLSHQHRDSQYEDCTPCRLMGSAAFTGLGIYTYYSGRRQLREREVEILRSGSRFGIGARKMGVFGMSAVLVGMGVYRLVN